MKYVSFSRELAGFNHRLNDGKKAVNSKKLWMEGNDWTDEHRRNSVRFVRRKDGKAKGGLGEVKRGMGQKETPASQQQVPDTGVYNRLNGGKRDTTHTRSDSSYGCVGDEYQGER